MDDGLISIILDSQELIKKTIEDLNKSNESMNDDLFSKLMSLSSMDSDKLTEEFDKQGIRQAEAINQSIVQNNQNKNIELEQITELELKKEGSILSEDSIISLTTAIDNLNVLLTDLNLSKTTETMGESKLETPININEANLDNVKILIDDFKTLSSLDWCNDWLNCLEKVVEQAGLVKESLVSIPEETKLSLGITDESIDKTNESLEKVKKDISADINLSSFQPEILETKGMGFDIFSTGFLDNFSEFNERISSLFENIEKSNVSSESFLKEVSQSSTETIKVIENSFSTNKEIQTEVKEKPIGVENIFEKVSSMFNPLQSPMMENIPNIPPPPPPMPFSLQELTTPFGSNLETITNTPNLFEGGLENAFLSNQNLGLLPLPSFLPEFMMGRENVISPITTTEAPTGVETAKSMPLPPPMMEGFMGQMPMPPMTMGVETATPMPLPIPTTTFLEEPESEEMVEGVDLDYASFYETFINNVNTRKQNQNTETVSETPATSDIFSQLVSNEAFETIPSETNQTETFGNESISLENPPIFEEKNTVSTPSLNPENIPFTSNMFGIPSLTGDIFSKIPSMESLPTNVPFLPQTEIGGNLFNKIESSGISSEIENSMPNFDFGLENILVKNQEQKAPSLASVTTSLQKVETPNTAEMMATNQAMAGEVNLEPIGNKIETSISGLSETLTKQSETNVAQTAPAQQGMSSDVSVQILELLKKLDATLSNQSTNVNSGQQMPSIGGGISESAARTIGRQIAQELKGNLTRLYN